MPRLLYGVTDWLTVRVAIPLEDRFRDFPDEGGQASGTGLGDIVVDPKILMYKGKTGSPSVALLAGVRLPTGDTESDIPLSDGSTDYVRRPRGHAQGGRSSRRISARCTG